LGLPVLFSLKSDPTVNRSRFYTTVNKHSRQVTKIPLSAGKSKDLKEDNYQKYNFIVARFK
jgi:hypothetical protein